MRNYFLQVALLSLFTFQVAELLGQTDSAPLPHEGILPVEGKQIVFRREVINNSDLSASELFYIVEQWVYYRCPTVKDVTDETTFSSNRGNMPLPGGPLIRSGKDKSTIHVTFVDAAQHKIEFETAIHYVEKTVDAKQKFSDGYHALKGEITVFDRNIIFILYHNSVEKKTQSNMPGTQPHYESLKWPILRASRFYKKNGEPKQAFETMRATYQLFATQATALLVDFVEYVDKKAIR